MMPMILPLTYDPRQILTLSPEIGGESFRARIEVRYLAGPDVWVLSLWNDSTEGQDYVNGARVQPDKLTLSVAETDAGFYGARPSEMLEALDRVRRARALCLVTVGGKSYDNMLLSDLTVIQDDQTPCGWTGTLVFTQATMISTVTRNDNSSRSVYIGNGSTARIASDEKKNAAEISRLLERAGIPS